MFLRSVPNGAGEKVMSIGWICSSNYTDGVHKVKHKLTDEELFVFVVEAPVYDDDFYMVLDCETFKVINTDEYDQITYYGDGKYFQCEEHPDVWLFDDGDELYDECPKCKFVEDEISSFKVADDVYQYKSNREFKRLKYLLKTDKYRFWRDNEEGDVKPKQGLFILITEYDSDGDEYYYYKTIEKGFIDDLEWSVK